MIRILIVDDHASIRDSFRSAFEQYDDLKVVGSVADAAFALFFCRDKQPDLVLMDICTAGGTSGLAATEKIKEAFPAIKVVVMTGFDVSPICRGQKHAVRMPLWKKGKA